MSKEVTAGSLIIEIDLVQSIKKYELERNYMESFKLTIQLLNDYQKDPSITPEALQKNIVKRIKRINSQASELASLKKHKDAINLLTQVNSLLDRITDFEKRNSLIGFELLLSILFAITISINSNKRKTYCRQV